MIQSLLCKAKLAADIDYFLMHQATLLMLDRHCACELQVTEERLPRYCAILATRFLRRFRS